MLNYFLEVSNKYSFPLIDVLMIAINRYGINASIPDQRIRFKIIWKDDVDKELFYLAVCVNTDTSPFFLSDNKIFCEDTYVADVFDIEKDTCDSTYFRRNHTALTLNSNARSECKGCKFCGSYNLEREDQEVLDSRNKLIAHFEKNILEKNFKISDLLRVTVCTGCFSNEDELIDHLLMINDVLKEFNFKGKLHYIGSQLTSYNAFIKIQKQIPDFSLSLTVECFENRNKLMRYEKAKLNLDLIEEIIKSAVKMGFAANYLYILGLDSLEEFKKGTARLKPYVNRLPIIQVLQNYLPEQNQYRNEESLDFEYYMKARIILENIFAGCNFRPRSWENYRGIFYKTYNNLKMINNIRI